MFKRTLSSYMPKSCCTLISLYHTSYNSSNKLSLSLKILATKKLKEDRTFLDTLRINLFGEASELEYYDSQSTAKNLKYSQSSMTTALVLPSSEHEIEHYKELIGRLANDENKYRVFALKLPGFGQSRILEKQSVYEHATIQKVQIVHEFLQVFLNFRKR